MIGITVLGSTGSIGVSTLDVIRRHPDRYRLIAISANSDVAGMRAQCVEWRPRFAVMSDAGAAERLRAELRQSAPDVEILSGAEGLMRVAALDEVHYVMAAIVGAAGLLPTLEAARAGKRVLLANKEALVMSGRLFMDAVREHGAELLPIDSEHNAIFQCMPPDFRSGLEQSGVRHILLTASGGPFRSTPLAELERVTPDQACAHPNWVMGRKISVDSATMMNKGLEVIEARWLFNARPDQIEVVIHPQSVIHSLVQYADGSVLAQLGNPDMRTPIAHALGHPERIASGADFLELARVGNLSFETPDFARFPCLRIAYDALRAGGTAVVALNAANEVAVAEFLDHRIGFSDIPLLIEQVVAATPVRQVTSIADVEETDRLARAAALSACAGRRVARAASGG